MWAGPEDAKHFGEDTEHHGIPQLLVLGANTKMGRPLVDPQGREHVTSEVQGWYNASLLPSAKPGSQPAEVSEMYKADRKKSMCVDMWSKASGQASKYADEHYKDTKGPSPAA